MKNTIIFGIACSLMSAPAASAQTPRRQTYQAPGTPASSSPKVFAPELCRAGNDLLKGRLPQEIDSAGIAVEYNYKPIASQIFVARNGDFFLQVPDLGAHGALKIVLSKSIPEIILDLDKDVADCRSYRSRPPAMSESGSMESRPGYPGVSPRVIVEESGPYLTLETPVAGADSVKAKVMGHAVASIELYRVKSGSRPGSGELMGSVQADSIRGEQVEIVLTRGKQLKKGDNLFVRSGLMESVLVAVEEEPAKPPALITKLDDLHAGGKQVKGFTQDATAKSIEVFINGETEKAGTGDVKDGTFSITLANERTLAFKDTVVAKTGKVSSTPMTVGRGIPMTSTTGQSSVNATVAVKPLDVTDAEVRSMAAPGTNINLLRDGIVTESRKAGPDGLAEFTLPPSNPLRPKEVVTVCSGAASSLNPDDCAATPVEQIRREGEQFRAVVGFAQSGSANANNSNKFFLDFYVSRPLVRPKGSREPWLRWWGNLRVASKPIEGASFSDLPGQAKGLKTNELAQAAEFLAGLDFQLNRITKPLLGQSEDSRQRFIVSFVAGLGATGTLSNTITGASAFNLPSDSSSLQSLQSFYPALKNAPGRFAVKSPDERFGVEYWGGFRVTTRYADKFGVPQKTPPAMVLFALGQSQAVTPGVLRGVVGRFETFYPLTTGNTNAFFSSLYLFGTAQLRFGGARFPAMTLSPDTTNPDLSALPTVFDRRTREQYSLGVGLDLVNVLTRAKITFH